jgi:hypothetical protein
MKFVCLRCGYNYYTKKNYIDHLTQTGKCQLKYLSISKQQLINNYYELYTQFKNTLSELMSNNDQSDNATNIRYVCLDCYNVHTAKGNLYRHRKNHCQVIKQNQLTIQNSNSNNAIGNNAVNSAVNSNNNNQVTNNNITINNYNNDDVITPGLRKKHLNIIKHKPVNAIPEVFKSVHIDVPKNRNVYIKDVKDGFALVMLNGVWTPLQMDAVLSDMVLQSANWIGEAIDDNRNILGKKGDFVEKIINQVEDDNDFAVNAWKNQIKYITYGGKDIIKNNYENIVGHKVKLNLKPKI